jgi:hypothetical protein
MGASVASFLGYFERFKAVAVLHPVLSTLLVVLTVGPAIMGAVSVWRGQPKAALWWAVFVASASFCLSWGDDTHTHVFRIVALSEQLRHGEPSLLLTNSVSGIALPTFVYYSLLPYVLPVALNLLGVPAFIAYKIAGVLELVVMARGLLSVAAKVVPRAGNGSKGTGSKSSVGVLAAVLFVSANYTYVLWTGRASLAEFWVFALIPWVVSCALSPRPWPGLILVFFLQAVAHPIVLGHSLLCEVPVVLGLARIGPVETARRLLPPLLIALVIAIPFWLPPALWQDLIRGPAALPADFGNSFLSIARLFDPKSNRNIGPWIPLAVLALIVVSRASLTWASWFLVASFAVMMGLQTVYLKQITIHIPTLELSLFIWRLMLPAAFLGFAALLSGWGEIAPDRRQALAVCAAISVLCMGILTTLAGADYIPDVAGVKSDQNERLAFDRDRENSIWGIREYLPNQAKLPPNCPAAGDVAPASFADLRKGLRAERPFLALERGPIGMVDYTANGKALSPGTCENSIVLGPVEPGATVRVSETRLDWLLAARAVELAGIAILLAFLGWRRTLSRG